MKLQWLGFLTMLLAGCGGGSDTTSATATAVAPAPAPISSTALKDNKVASTTKFDQFSTFLAQLPNKTAKFNSTTIYIKVYTADGNTLYLGVYRPNVPLSLHLPNHIKLIKIDIFSADPQDPQFTEEIVV